MPPYRLPMYHRQSPAVRCINFLCAFLLGLVLIVGIIFFVLWLSLRPHRPKFYLADFSIPNANRQSSSGLANQPVSFTVAEHNPNQKIGIYYNEIVASVYYNDELVAKGPIAQPFYQPPKGDVALQGQLTATGPTSTDPAWGRFSAELGAGSGVEMRLELTSTVQFQVKMWDTKHHHMKAECDIRINGDGTLQQQYKNSQCSLFF